MVALLYLTEEHIVDYKSALDRDLANNMTKEHTGRKGSADEYTLICSSPHLSRAYGYSSITDVEHDDSTRVESTQ